MRYLPLVAPRSMLRKFLQGLVMSKKFLFIVDPLNELNVKTDTTLALIEEACSRGITTYACELKDISLIDGKLHFNAGVVKLAPGYLEPPSYLSPCKSYPSEEFSAVFMRKDPPVDEEFIAALYMLRCYDPKKTLMVNNPDALLLANEKLFGQKIAPQYFSKTLVSSNREQIEKFAEQNEKIVLKPLFSSGGSGVLVAEKDDKNLLSMMELLSFGFKKPIMVQKYIKDARLGDKRIIVVGGEAKGAINRKPNDKDHRANFHAGGKPESCEITPNELEIVKALKPHLLSLGLHLVGIDVIAGHLTEINVTSPTCVLEIEKTTNPHLRKEIIDHVLSLLKA